MKVLKDIVPDLITGNDASPVARYGRDSKAAPSASAF